MKKYLFLLGLIFIIKTLSAQKSYLVRVEDKIDTRTLSNIRSSSGLRYSSIITSPMNVILVEGDDHLTSDQVKSELGSDFQIIAIQPNRKIRSRTIIPNDSLLQRQWQYNNDGINSNNGLAGADIGAFKAWDITTGGKTLDGREIVIAVIDDGVVQNHPDLKENLWKNIAEIPDNKIDDDGNGYIDDYNGWNVVAKNDKVDNDASHGSPVAGIIGAKGNNGIGVAGVNWNVKIMPIYYGNATEANAIASYAYVYQMRKLYNESNGAKGAFVVATNSSWGIDGGQVDEAPLWCAMYDTLGKVGVLSVASTANNTIDVEVEGDLPTSCPSPYLIATTNVEKTNQRANAGFGYRSIDIAAYGSSVFTISKSSYASFNGTSASAPHVAGAIGLIYAAPCATISNLLKLSPAQSALAVKDLLLNNAKKINSYEGLTTTEGVLNLELILKNVMNQCTPCTAPLSVTDKIVQNKNIVISWLPTTALKQVRYRKGGGNFPWTTVPFTSTDSIKIDGADFCTEYAYQLRYICGNDTSGWGYTKYVNTEACCNSPSKLKIQSSEKDISMEGNPDKQYILALSNNLNNQKDTFKFNGSYNFTNVQPCVFYSISIAEYCEVQGRYSGWSIPVNQSSNCGECSSAYCAPGIYDNDSEWIEEVTINNKSIVSGKSADGFSELIGSYVPEIKKGDSITVTIKPGFKGSSFKEFFSIYVDWNGDKTFTSAELAYDSKEAFTGKVTAKFIVPDFAKFGLTRMRCIMSYTGKQAGCAGNGEYGETEDYCIKVTQPNSLADDLDKDQIALFPNPTSGNFTVQSKTKINYVKIYDSTGKTLYQSEVKNQNKFESSLFLNQGVYLVEVTNDNQRFFRKLAVMP
jgi:serine protease